MSEWVKKTAVEPDLSTQLDITTDGEYADHGEVKIVMTREQATALANSLHWNVDLETVELDNGEPQRAELIRAFIALVRGAGL